MFSRLFTNTTRINHFSSAWKNIGLRFQSTAKHATPPKPATGIKKLIQQYGYSALGVYLSISIIDIPLCFMVVHSAGEDTIREYQDKVKTFFGYQTTSNDPDAVDEDGKPVEKSSTLLTEFALAYAVHKSLIFIRLPIAAAITPWVVKQLLAWGFRVGPNAKKAATVIKNAKKFDATGKSSGL